jgi:hypothetical protein
MYPETGLVKDTSSDAERKVYNALKQTLDDNYYVFHSTLWVSPQDGGLLKNGEVDFIIIHPEHGILLLEAKGGDILIDGATKEWTSRDRFQVVHKIQDPFKQVSASVHFLKRKLQELPRTKNFATRLWLMYGVWFPDVKWQPGAVSLPHVIDELVLDATDLVNPEPGMLRLFHFNPHGKTPRLKQTMIDALIDVFAPTTRIKSTLAVQFANEEREYAQLTDDQMHRLAVMSRYPRVTVRGAAGTGKTVLALERAHRLAEQDLDVLFVCENPALAYWIASLVDREPQGIRSLISVYHVEQLCLEISGEAGMVFGDIPESMESAGLDELGDRIRQTKLASLLTRSLDKLERQEQRRAYDAILVDEAQNIERALWGPIFKMLRDRQNGLFYAFYDPAQRESDDDWEPPIVNGHRELILTDNIRNTQTIFNVALPFYPGAETPQCRGPEGRSIWCHNPATEVPASVTSEDREAAALETVLDRLIDHEGIAPEDILVISFRAQRPNSPNASRLYRRQSVGKHLVQNHLERIQPNHVTVTTVRAAKGLERKVVVLAELDGIDKEPDKRRNTFMYIAITRAVNHLIILGTKEQLVPRQASLWTAQRSRTASQKLRQLDP